MKERNPASESHCPYDWFRKLRQSTPVAELQPGVFAITRDAVGGNNPFALFGPSPVQDKIDDIMRIYPEEPVLMRTDPPAHTRVRNLVNRALSTAEVNKLEPQIHDIVESLAAPRIGTGAVEFLSAFAALLPNAVTTAFIGAPAQMREQFRFLGAEVMLPHTLLCGNRAARSRVRNDIAKSVDAEFHHSRPIAWPRTVTALKRNCGYHVRQVSSHFKPAVVVP